MLAQSNIKIKKVEEILFKLSLTFKELVSTAGFVSRIFENRALVPFVYRNKKASLTKVEVKVEKLRSKFTIWGSKGNPGATLDIVDN